MKKLLIFFFLFSVSIGFAQSKVEVEVDTTSIRIGEQIQYKIRVNDLDKVVFPEFKSDAAKKAVLIAEKPTDTFVNKLEKKYLITYFDGGKYKIPRQTVEIDKRKYFTKEFLVNVATVKVDTTQQKMFDIKTIKEEPKVFDDYKNLIIYLLIFLLVVALLIYFLTKKKKDPEKAVKRIDPYVEAIQKLKELDKNEELSKKNVKKYYSELTDIARSYIEKELSISAMESTTNELIDELFLFAKSSELKIKKETIRALKNILQNADFVKFAKSMPAAEMTQKDRLLIEQVVEEIKKSVDNHRNASSIGVS
jgi:hypothetical protein